MRIAFFMDSSMVLGGAGNILLEQAKIMSFLHDVIVVIPCNEKGETNSEYLLRCKKMSLRYVEFIYATTPYIQYIDIIKSWKDIDEIKRWACRENIELFHSTQLNITAEMISRELHIPHLMNIYQLRKEEFVFNQMDIFPRYHSCDSLLYCHIWEENLGVKTCCIRSSAPLKEIRKKKRKKKEALKILMLGGIEERKNQLNAIKAVEYCSKNGMDIKLTIVGDDNSEYAKECNQYIQQNTLGEIIFAVGFQSDIVPYLLENDCYLCSSIDESFPSSIVEAITYDLTIISTPVAGVPELLHDRINAYISRGYDSKHIAECILNCFMDYKNGFVWTLHNKAEQLWKECFSIESVKEKLNSYYSYIRKDYYKSSPKCIEEKISKQEIMDVYKKIYKLSEEIPEIRGRCYYYTCLKNMLKTGNAYIWGAGKYGKYAKKIIEILFPEIKVIAYIDQRKIGHYIGIPIIEPDCVNTEKVDYIFIGFVNGRNQVIQYLQEKNFEYNRNIWILP